MKCKDCGQEKERIRIALTGKQAKYVGYCGRQWAGFQCPDCKYKRQDLTPVLTLRSCRKCGTLLPQDKYFYHSDCYPGKFVQEEFVYG